MGRPTGFRYVRRKGGEVVISHHGTTAVVLRGRTAERFLERVADEDAQQVMARYTGNYKRGNER